MLAVETLDRQATLRAMRDRFNQPDPDAGRKLVLVLGMLACLLALVWLVHRFQQRRARVATLQPMGLYLRVQSKLGLSLLDRWRLWQLAQVLRIEHPTALLISARMYDEVVKEYCGGQGWLGSRARFATHFTSLRHQLFPSSG